MKYHYSRKEGWLGNPCGLVYFKGRYHLFFQLNPESPRYGRMHWGHAVSDDLITWEDLPVAIFPDSEMSCNSGSAIVHEGKIWLFYTSVSEDYKETVCAAYSEDGTGFVKCAENPIVTVPLDGNVKFRDPFVMKCGNGFRMLLGAGQNGIGKVLHFESEDLINWNYKGELLSDGKFGSVIESPHLAEVDGKWVFIIQSEKHVPTKVLFATGEYDGDRFVFEVEAVHGVVVDSAGGLQFVVHACGNCVEGGVGLEGDACAVGLCADNAAQQFGVGTDGEVELVDVEGTANARLDIGLGVEDVAVEQFQIGNYFSVLAHVALQEGVDGGDGEADAELVHHP